MLKAPRYRGAFRFIRMGGACRSHMQQKVTFFQLQAEAVHDMMEKRIMLNRTGGKTR